MNRAKASSKRKVNSHAKPLPAASRANNPLPEPEPEAGFEAEPAVFATPVDPPDAPVLSLASVPPDPDAVPL